MQVYHQNINTALVEKKKHKRHIFFWSLNHFDEYFLESHEHIDSQEFQILRLYVSICVCLFQVVSFAVVVNH